MSTPPNKPVRPAAPPPKAASPAAIRAAAPPPAAAPTWSPAKGGPSNKNLFIILGVAAVVLFLVLTIGLLVALVGGGSSTNPTGPMFPDEGVAANPNANLPPDPGPVAHKPRDAVHGFLHDLQKNDVGKAYGRTSESFQTTTTLPVFRDTIYLRPGLRHYTNFELKPLSPEAGDSVHYQGKVWGGRYATVEFTIEVVRDRRGWAVREFSPE